MFFFHLHNITSPKTKYVGFTTEFYEMTNNKINITVRIDLVFEEYNLYNKIPFDIFNLNFNNSYYLYLKFFETINISLIIKNITQKRFLNI